MNKKRNIKTTSICPNCGMIKIDFKTAKQLEKEVDIVRKKDILAFVLQQTDIPQKYRDIINKNFGG